jgi:hypothetical protein
MTTALEPEFTTYRWSSHEEADRFPVEDPATGEVITVVQGGGTAELNAAVEAAHRAFRADWRWRTPAERAALLLKAADVLAEAMAMGAPRARCRRPGGPARLPPGSCRDREPAVRSRRPDSGQAGVSARWRG